MSDGSYAGDVSPTEAWAILEQEPDAVLIDVRTDAEWRYVGLPALQEIGRQTVCVSWLLFPDNATNPQFANQVREQGVGPDQTLLMICRSGQRSKSAAVALTALGFDRCFNVAEGFEGDKDSSGHRGTVGGWKAAGLPWEQG